METIENIVLEKTRELCKDLHNNYNIKEFSLIKDSIDTIKSEFITSRFKYGEQNISRENLILLSQQSPILEEICLDILKNNDGENIILKNKELSKLHVYGGWKHKLKEKYNIDLTLIDHINNVIK